jgi:hypothetical protein
MRGETSFEVPHPNFPDVMIYQQPDINVRLRAADLLARAQGDYFVRTEITLGVDYAEELTRLKQLSNNAEIDDYTIVEEAVELSFI